MREKWDGENMYGDICYVRVRGIEARTEFVEFLEKNGFVCKEDEVTTRESTIESMFPITVDIEHKLYGHVHNKTCAAAAVSSGSVFSLHKFYMLLEGVSPYIIV